MRPLLIVSLVGALLGGCSKSGSLVFVTVDAAAPIASATRLHVILADGSKTRGSDLSLSPATFPPAHTFAVDVGSGVDGMLSISVEAFAADGSSVGSASGSIAIVAGQRVDLHLTLGGAPADMSLADMTGAAPPDLAPPADMTGVPPPDMVYHSLTWVASHPPAASQNTTIWAADAQHIWIGAENMVNNLYSTGNDTWTQVTSIPAFQSTGIWGPDASHVYLVDTNDTIRAWDPTTTNWSTTAYYTVYPNLSPSLNAIWGTSLTDIWIAGSSNSSATGSYVFHNSSGSIDNGWSPSLQGSGKGLFGISGSGSRLYAVGALGEIEYTGDAANWHQLSSGVTTDLLGVFVLDASHIYVVGKSGVILFSSGTGTFTKQTIPAQYAAYQFNAVWAADADNVFVVGDTGAVLHGDSAGNWVPQLSGVEIDQEALTGVWGTSATNVYVCGGGYVSHGQ